MPLTYRLDRCFTLSLNFSLFLRDKIKARKKYVRNYCHSHSLANGYFGLRSFSRRNLLNSHYLNYFAADILCLAEKNRLFALLTNFVSLFYFKGTALGLLEAQAGVGSIIDPLSGEKMSVSEALQKNLLDRQFAAVLARAERAVIGFKVKGTDESLSLFQAMKRVWITASLLQNANKRRFKSFVTYNLCCNFSMFSKFSSVFCYDYDSQFQGLVVENHGIRLLEAQIATGGIIDPVANHRLPVEKAFERGNRL